MQTDHLSLMLLIAAAKICGRQDMPRGCPAIKMYTSVTQINFQLGSLYATAEAGKYVKTRNSCDWMHGAYIYNSPSNVATVLFGAWQHKRDAYQYTHAAYDLNAVNTNLTSIKNIKCDAVQDMAIQIEGRPVYIGQVLKGIDTAALKKIITASF